MTIHHNDEDLEYLDKGVRDIRDESPIPDEERTDGLWVFCEYIYNHPKPFPCWSFIKWGSHVAITCDRLANNWSHDNPEIPF